MATGKKLIQVYGNLNKSDFIEHNSKGKRNPYIKIKGKIANKNIRQNKISIKEALSEKEEMEDEVMCRSCQFFEDEEWCPHYGEVDSLTNHNEVNCKRFWS